MSEENVTQPQQPEEVKAAQSPTKSYGAQSKRASSPVEPKRFERGSQEFTHDLFKLKVATMKKNTSWVVDAPRIVEMEHTHFFHSINDTTMQPNKHCSPVGGHFHEVTVVPGQVDKDGFPLVKVGPPMTMVNIKLPGGASVKRSSPVEYPMIDMNSGQRTKVVDSHTHEVEYQGSQVFTSVSRTNAMKEERAKVAGLMSGPSATQAQRSQQMTNQPGSDAAKSVLRES